MKVSVAITTYNGEKYIIEQLTSVLNQTRPVDEVIIADDCSLDDTPKIVRSFIAENHLSASWHFYINDYNLGYANNFKQLIYSCKGDVVFFCDQDDVWVEDRVEKMMKVMESNGDISVLYTKECRFTEDENSVKHYEAVKCTNSLKKINFTPHTRYLRTEGCTMCVRKTFLEEIKSEWYNGWAHDEAVWSFAVLKDALYYYDYISVLYRRHGGNVSGNKQHGKEKRIQYLRTVLSSSEQMVGFAKKKSLAEYKIRTCKKTLNMARYRLRFMESKNIFLLIPLAFYIKYYYSWKSYFTEIFITFKGKQ